MSPTGADTTNRFPQVAAVNASASHLAGESCTATLISPSHMLLAAHCVGTAPAGEVTFVADGVETTVATPGCAMVNAWLSVPQTSASGGGLRPAPGFAAALAFGDTCGVASHTPTTFREQIGVDFAVLQLIHPIPHDATAASTRAPRVAIRPAAVSSAPSSTFAAIAVGFGPTSDTTPAGTRMFRNLMLSWGPEVIEGPLTLLGGDSGGPLFRSTSAGLEVVGVASGSDPTVTFRSFWGSLGSTTNPLHSPIFGPEQTIVAWIAAHVDTNGGGPDVFCPGPAAATTARSPSRACPAAAPSTCSIAPTSRRRLRLRGGT